MDSFDSRANKYSSERVELYDRALAQVPDARFQEREHLISRLNLKDGLSVCDVSAGTGYLSDGINDHLQGQVSITCVENSQAFVELLKPKYRTVKSSLTGIDVADCSFDRVGTLAGVHHQQDKVAFYQEAHRILRPGGRLVIGDVLEGSPPARFLNGPVDIYSDIGHDGMFLREREISADLKQAGFGDMQETVEHYTWRFPDEQTLIVYCKNLFRMTKATLQQVSSAISEHLKVTHDTNGCYLHWQLLFVTADKN